MPAKRAYELGLINHVVPDGQALAKAKEIAERITKNGPLAVKAIVATLRETETLPEADAFVIEQQHGMAVMGVELRERCKRTWNPREHRATKKASFVWPDKGGEPSWRA